MNNQEVTVEEMGQLVCVVAEAKRDTEFSYGARHFTYRSKELQNPRVGWLVGFTRKAVDIRVHEETNSALAPNVDHNNSVLLYKVVYWPSMNPTLVFPRDIREPLDDERPVAFSWMLNEEYQTNRSRDQKHFFDAGEIIKCRACGSFVKSRVIDGRAIQDGPCGRCGQKPVDAAGE